MFVAEAGEGEEEVLGYVSLGLNQERMQSEAQEFVFPFDRPRHRNVTCQVALDWVRRTLLGEERVAPRYLRRAQ